MTFEWPALLWALLALPAVALAWLVVRRRRRRRAASFANPALLPNLIGARPGWRTAVPVACYLLATSVLLVALARPEANARVPRDQATVMLLLDTSRSMLSHDVAPTRDAAARQTAAAFLDRLPDRFQVGLVSFAASPRVESRPTRDREAVRQALLTAPTRFGTAIGDALVRTLAASGALAPGDPKDRPPVTVLLVTDGGNESGVPPLVVAELARRQGVPVFTVAVGGKVPDRDMLAQIAQVTGGRAFSAGSRGQLDAVWRDLGSRITYVREKRELTSVFMGGAALLLTLGAAASIAWFQRLP
jgi:Ca-activated chloride channel family protein